MLSMGATRRLHRSDQHAEASLVDLDLGCLWDISRPHCRGSEPPSTRQVGHAGAHVAVQRDRERLPRQSPLLCNLDWRDGFSYGGSIFGPCHLRACWGQPAVALCRRRGVGALS